MRSFFSRLFRCFSPGSAYVVPVVETADSISSEAKKLGRGVKQKSQLDAHSPDTETDCIRLIEMIKVDVNATVTTTFRDPTMAILFSFVDLTISSAFRAPGGKAPNGISLFRMLVGRTILRDVNDLNTESDTKALVYAISSFLDNLERPHKQEQKRSNPSLSHEGLVILTDLLLLAIHDYVSNSENNMQLGGDVFSCFERLCLTLKALCSLTDSTYSGRVRLLLCQCTARACKIIRAIGFSCAVTHDMEIPSSRQIVHIASALNALSLSLMMIRQLCGEESCAVSMLLWSACESLSCVVDIMPNPRSRGYRGYREYRDSKLDKGDRGDRENKGYEMDRGEKEDLDFSGACTMIFDSLRLTAPSPNDLLLEIHRLQSDHTQIPIGRPVRSRSGNAILDTGGFFSGTESKVGTDPSDPNYDPKGVEGPIESFRLQYLLDGLQVMLRAGILEIRNEKHSEMRVIQEREKWMVSIAECLLFVLDHSLPSGRTNTPGGQWGVSASSPVTCLAPILSGIFLEIALSFDKNTLENTQNIHWIFWELAKRLAEFTEKLIQGKKSMSIVLKKNSRIITGSADAASARRDIQAINGKLQLQLQLSYIKHQDVTFMLDDVVDGLWVLANGTQRWYPGRISQVNKEGTYSVKYLDGDVHEHKTAAEIRHSKNSKLSTARSIRNLHSERRDTDTSRERSDSPMRPNGALTGLNGVNAVTSRNSSTDSGSNPSPFFSLSNSSDFNTGEGGLHFNEGKSFTKKTSFRSISGTPRLTGVLENSLGWGGSEDMPRSAGSLKRPTLHQAAIDSLDGSFKSQDNLKLALSSHSPSTPTLSKKILKTPKDFTVVPHIGIGICMPDSSNPETPRAAPFLGQMKQLRSWKSDGSGFSGDSNESDGQTFAIPSVFPTPRSERKVDALVPRMQFANLDLSSAAIPGAGMSLSASICRETRDDIDASGSDDDSEADLIDTSRSSTDLHVNGPGSICTPRSNALIMHRLTSTIDNFDDDVSVSHKVLTWRDQGHSVKRASHPGNKIFETLDSMANCSGKGSRQSSGRLSNLQTSSSGRNLLSMKSSPFASFRKDSGGSVERMTPKASYLQGTGYDEQTLFVLIRAFSIISASLLQRCVVGEGTFLDISTCTTHETESSKSLLTNKRRKSESHGEDTPTTSFKSLSETGKRVQSLDSAVDETVQSLGAKRRGRSQSKVQKNHINMLFSIREFLESIPDTEQSNITPFLTEISNFSLGASMRLLKLVSPSMFVSCLPSHMKEAEKIGMGGFGSVFKVCCDSSCVERAASSFATKNTPYQSYNSRSNSGKRTQLMNAFNAGNKQSATSLSVKNDNGSTAFRTFYAVKRIPRERSVYDPPIVYDVFSEITSLELLSGNKGVCELIDFGVEGVEYWMVMEAGKMDLLAWRTLSAPKPSRSKRIPPTRTSPIKESRYPHGTSMRSNGMTDLEESTGEECIDSPKGERGERGDSPKGERGDSPKGEREDECKEEPLTRNKMTMCLALYADALLIVQSIHSAHILHFDIKCNNFILRCEPDLDNMYRAHEKGLPSGYLFLADFGESVPSLVSYSDRTTLTAEALVKQEGSADTPNSMRSSMSCSDIVKGGPSNLSRSRGTLAIQSPEMLCLSASDNSASNLSVVPTRPTGPPPAHPTQTPTQTPVKTPIQTPSQTPSPAAKGSSNSEMDTQNAPPTENAGKIGNRKYFPPPSAASDVWSLGCLLIELLTGHYLMADRPWTDLYVSFCMKKFVPPSFDLLHKAVKSAGGPIDLLPRLEALGGKCLKQDPNDRAKIHELFEDLMTMVIEHGALTPPKLISHSDSNSYSSMSSAGLSHGQLEPRHVSSVLLSMKNLLSPKQVSRWSVNKTFNVVRWNRETSRLRPRSLDFRCGSGLVITLLGSEEFPTHVGSAIHPSKYPSNHPRSKRNSAACHPYLSSIFLGRDYNQDMSLELNARIEAASKMVTTASLATCAKSLAQKSVVNFVRDEGVFHIEISCGPQANCCDEGDTKRTYFMRGIERLVLPVWCGTNVEVDENECDFTDDLLSDMAVMKQIDRLLHLARATLSEAIPPAILITIVPYALPPGEHFADPAYPRDTLSPHAYPQSERESKERKDTLRCGFLDRDDKEEAAACVYSRVALTVAMTLADHFAKAVTISAGPDHATFRTPKGTEKGPVVEVHGQATSPKGSHLLPRSNSESRRKHFEFNKAVSIVRQSQSQTRRRSFAVSQSLHAVAPWLSNALHPEFQSFLTERLSLPHKNLIELN